MHRLVRYSQMILELSDDELEAIRGSAVFGRMMQRLAPLRSDPIVGAALSRVHRKLH